MPVPTLKLHSSAKVLESCADKVPSKSRPEMGVIHEHWTATNQKGELVMTAKGINMVRRKPA